MRRLVLVALSVLLLSGGVSAAPARVSNVDLVGHIGGYANAMAVQASTAYVTVGPRLLVFDASDPAAPRLVGRSEPMVGAPSAVAAAGAHVYVAASGGGLHVVRVADPTAPRVVGTYAEPDGVGDVAAAGAVAYVTVLGGVQVLDVSDPTRPRRAGTFPVQLFELEASGPYVFGADVADRKVLRVVDASSLAAPREVGSVALPGEIRRLAVSGQLGFAVHSVDRFGQATLTVIDLSQPTAPRLAGSLSVRDAPPAASGRVAYVGHDVVDASDPNAPAVVGRLPVDGVTVAVTFAPAAAGATVYVADGDLLRVISTADPRAPRQLGAVGFTPDRYTPLAVNEPYLYALGQSFYVVDVSDPGQPRIVGTASVSQDGVGSWFEADFAAGRVYVPGAAGVSIVDVSTPTAPRELALYRSPRSVRAVAVAGLYLYAAASEAGLRVVDVSNPSAPREVASYLPDCGPTFSSPCLTFDVEADGRYVYLGRQGGVDVLDATDPTQLRLVGRHESFTSKFDVAGPYLYALCGLEGSRVVDLNDPSRPRTIAKLPLTGGGCEAIEAVGDRVYVAGQDGLHVVDVSDPRCPVEVGARDVRAFSLGAERLVVGRDLAYLDENLFGLYFLRPTGPAAAPRPVTMTPGPFRQRLPFIGQSAPPRC